MSLEERIQQSVEAALIEMRARVEADVRAMVQQLIAAAAEERNAAVESALNDAAEEAGRQTARQVADAEARVRATVDQLVDNARQKERDLATEAAQRAAEVETAQRVDSAVAAAREEMRLALVNAEERAQQALKESVGAARVGEREAEMASLSRLLESIRGLDGATSLSEVLDALGQAAAREASRAAVLVLRNDRLLGWRLSGFGPRDAQPKQIDLALTEAGVLGLAVGSARVVTTRDQLSASGPGFAHLPEDRMGLAVPVIVGGRVVGVLYADGLAAEGREQAVPSSWPEIIEILARHAARCLEALTVQKAAATSPSPRFWVPPAGKATPPSTEPPQPQETTGAQMSRAQDADRVSGVEESARRIARLLLSDIRLFHQPAVDEGRRTGNLLSRLGPEIERARRVYDERVPASLRTRAELFHQELVATLAGGDAALLGLHA